MSYEITTIHHFCRGQLGHIFADIPEKADDPLLWQHGNQDGLKYCPYCAERLAGSWAQAVRRACRRCWRIVGFPGWAWLKDGKVTDLVLDQWSAGHMAPRGADQTKLRVLLVRADLHEFPRPPPPTSSGSGADPEEEDDSDGSEAP